MRLASEGSEQLIPESGELESPSLFADVEHGPAAYELKFLLTEERARAVEERVGRTLALDAHADPARGNAYPILSLYTDTPEFDVYRRTPAAGGCKYRVRRYGAAGPMFVEQKIKTGDRVRKRRAPVNELDLEDRVRGAGPAEWSGGWYPEGIAAQNLTPICRIGYDRLAFLGADESGTIRVTFDRNVCGESETAWELKPVDSSLPLLDGEVICEFKFRLAMPGFFKALVEEFGLVPSAVSKYRRFMQSRLATGSGADA